VLLNCGVFKGRDTTLKTYRSFPLPLMSGSGEVFVNQPQMCSLGQSSK